MGSNPQANAPRSLYLAMLLQFAVGGAVVPFVTILLRDRGLDYGQIGQVFFFSSSTLLVFPFLWGMLADRYLPINRVFTLTNLLGAGSLVLLFYARSYQALLMSFTCFYACFNPSLSLMNALGFHHLHSPRTQFGPLRSWGSLGWILPSLPIWLWLIGTREANLSFVVWMAAGLSVAMGMVTFLLPHTPPGGRVDREREAGRLAYWPAVKRLLTDGNYVTILVSFFLMMASFSILVLFSPPFLEEHGVGRAWIGPVQCLGVVLEIILFRWQPRFVRSWTYPASILIGCLALLARHLLFAFSHNPWLLCGSYLLAGMVIVFYHIGISILVNAIATAQVRATAQTLLVFFGSGMGPMAANWLAGRLAAAAGEDLRPVFLFAAALAGLASLLIFLRRNSLRRAAG